jgi:hypothetical protein
MTEFDMPEIKSYLAESPVALLREAFFCGFFKIADLYKTLSMVKDVIVAGDQARYE